jgi:hypothetical protein
MSLLIQSVLIQVLLIHGKPMIEKGENRIAIFNEIMVSLYLLTSITLTGF